MAALGPNQLDVNGVLYDVSQIFYNGTVFNASYVAPTTLLLLPTFLSSSNSSYVMLKPLLPVHSRNLLAPYRNLSLPAQPTWQCSLRRRLRPPAHHQRTTRNLLPYMGSDGWHGLRPRP